MCKSYKYRWLNSDLENPENVEHIKFSFLVLFPPNFPELVPRTEPNMENISIFSSGGNKVALQYDAWPAQPFAGILKSALAIAAIVLGSIGWAMFKTLLPATLYQAVQKGNDKTLRPQPARKYPHWEPFMGLDLLAVITFGLMRGKFLYTASKLVQKYGGPSYTVAYNFIGKPVIATFEPRNIKELLSNRFRDYTHGEDRLNTLRPLLGDGIFNCTGETWRVSRLCSLAPKPALNRQSGLTSTWYTEYSNVASSFSL